MHLKLTYTCIRKLKIFAGHILRNPHYLEKRKEGVESSGMIDKGREDEGGKKEGRKARI
jgi:hypothetical protein